MRAQQEHARIRVRRKGLEPKQISRTTSWRSQIADVAEFVMVIEVCGLMRIVIRGTANFSRLVAKIYYVATGTGHSPQPGQLKDARKRRRKSFDLEARRGIQ